MKNSSSLTYNVSLVVGDAVAVIAAFTLAYILRVSINHRVLSAHVHAITYITILASLLPFWLIIFSLLGLYTSRVYERRFNELGRLIIGSLIGILFIISYSYMFNVGIFPARLVTIYAFIFAVVFIVLFRTAIREVRRELFRYGYGVNNVLLVGDTKATMRLIEAMRNIDVTGQRVVGVVGGSKHSGKADNFCKTYASFDSAVSNLKGKIHSIIQTELYSDTNKNDEVLNYAQQHHIAYGFVPGNSELFFGNIEVDLLHSIPIIAVHQTALIGWGRVVKRLSDLFFGTIFLIISLPFMIVIALAVKLTDGGPIFYRQERLTRYNNKFVVFKFRSHKAELSQYGLTTEEAFKMLGKEDLIKEYRRLGDRLPNDPRVTKVGRFIRKYSLDELPQLFNVLRGDISLVGPRSLVPNELAMSPQKNLILSVKSGLTGLAQISGVSDLSFEERRKLDLYYVENWSFRGDLVIMIKTFWVVLWHKGTRA
ncbi:MAG TPA: sugar transferase [Candidatus Saccharimonadales bacterium]|nr:sugar transferase [Candidatus Saccharimonadales bacterium]